MQLTPITAVADLMVGDTYIITSGKHLGLYMLWGSSSDRTHRLLTFRKLEGNGVKMFTLDLPASGQFHPGTRNPVFVYDTGSRVVHDFSCGHKACANGSPTHVEACGRRRYVKVMKTDRGFIPAA